jgi:hypothetical protein
MPYAPKWEQQERERERENYIARDYRGGMYESLMGN